MHKLRLELIASAALTSVLAAAPLYSQVTTAPAGRVGGRVAVQVFVTIADDEVSRRPVSGLTLGFIRSANDTSIAVTDRSGEASILLTPGQYRVVSLVPIQWKGLRYSWNTAVAVRQDMQPVDLGSSQATISRIAVVAAESFGETAPPIPPAAATPPDAPTTSIPLTLGVKSHSSGFFIGIGFEDDALASNDGSPTESGSGGGLVVGYGFNRRWALYGDLSGAVMNANGGGTYSLAHADLGARVHFRTGPNVVVPFLQFGLTGRTVAATIDGSNVTGTGGGISFGGGLNVHLSPSVALSGALTWAVGNFNDFRVDNWSVGNYSVNATTGRFNLGIIWFPQ